MCHLLLLLPVVALPVFWLLPLPAALPLYAVAAGIGVGFYLFAWKVYRTPPANGLHRLIGATGSVVSVGARSITLRVGGELWMANVQDGPLTLGQRAVVVRVDGLRLTARPVDKVRTETSAA